MLRHYESLGLLVPSARTSVGYREYGEHDLRRIFHIESLRSLGLGLKEVKQALEDPAFSVEAVLNELIADSRERLKQERALFDRLVAVRAAGATDWDEALVITAMLRDLRSPDPARRQASALSQEAGIDPKELARAALKETNPNAAGALTWAVLRAGEKAVNEVLRGLEATDFGVRRQAVRILTEAPEVPVRHLLTALQDEDPEIRALVALPLGRRGQREAMRELMDMILTGRHDVDAAEVLAGQEDWGTEVLRSLENSLRCLPSSDPARARITQALAEFAGSTPLLTTLINDDTPQVAMTARAILSTRGMLM